MRDPLMNFNTKGLTILTAIAYFPEEPNWIGMSSRFELEVSRFWTPIHAALTLLER